MLKMFLMQIALAIPIPVKFDEKVFARSMMLSPLAGFIIGIILGFTYYFAHLTEKPLFAAVVVVAAWIVLTGGLHLDGLADTSDGNFSNRPKKKNTRNNEGFENRHERNYRANSIILGKTALPASIDGIISFLLSVRASGCFQ